MKYKQIALILCGIILCFACKKDKHHTVTNGTVIDATTQQPVAYATINLIAENFECVSCGYQYIEQKQTDANGNFSFDFTAEDRKGYYLRGIANNYFNTYQPVQIETGEKYNKKNKNKQINIMPMAWVKIHFKNTTQMFEADINGTSQLITGPFADVMIYLKDPVQGNKDLQLVYWIFHSNNDPNPERFIKNFFCKPLDTTLINITY
jgi:hypothetical protein